MKARKVKGKDSKRWQKAVIGMLLALIMFGSVIAMLTHSTSGSDITQTTVRNGYIVNPDNVTISMDGNTTTVLVGQSVQFLCDGNKSGPVTVSGVTGTPTEGYVFFTSNTGWLDTSGMIEGLYNATYGEHWELLVISKPVMDLGLKVGEKEVSTIAVGTPLGIDFNSNLDGNDCVDLKVVTPEGYVLKQNPADPDQKFDDINVSQLLEYRSENESKRINTTGWEIGTYTFSVRTEKENARGLAMLSNTRTLTILKAEISIEAEKTSIVELEKVRLTVTGAPKHNITISSSDPAHTIFPTGYEDNPSYSSSGFNDTLDADGVRRYVVYFNDTGSYTIRVTDTTAGLYDSVDISVSEKAVIFDVPSTVVIGTKFTIKGTANTGNTVDIAVEGYAYPQLNDLLIKADKSFAEEIDTATTNITPFTIPGTVKLDAYVDRALGAGEIGENETADGITVIFMMKRDLEVELSTDKVAAGDSFEVYGIASSDYVEIVAISPQGGNGTGMDGLYGVSIYTVPTFNLDSYKIHVSVDQAATKNLTTGEPVTINGTTNRENGTVISIITEPDINISEKAIEFDVPVTCVIGEKVIIRGTASVGSSVDIAIEDVIKAIDIPIDEDGTFQTDISSSGYIPGSYIIEGFIDGNYSIGEDVSGEESDGATSIRLIEPGLIANISTNVTVPGGSFVINGTATGTDHVDIITISPEGGDGMGFMRVRLSNPSFHQPLSFDIWIASLAKVNVVQSKHIQF